MTDLVVVSHKFCPRGYVGTRRWSKLCKYLSRDIRIHVICAEYNGYDAVNWCHDVEENDRIVIHRIASRYPEYMVGRTDNKGLKAIRELTRQLIYPMDESQYWCLPLVNKLKELIGRYSIRWIVATGPPFAFWPGLAKFVKTDASLSLVLDYRDQWSLVSPVKRNFLRQIWIKCIAPIMERRVLKNAQVALYATPDLRDRYIENLPSCRSKMVVLHNGYDAEDYPDYPSYSGEDGVQREGIRFIYAGGLLGGRLDAILLLVQAITSAGCEDFHFDFFGCSRPSLETLNGEEVKTYNEYFHFNGAVTQERLHVVMSRYKYGLNINAPGSSFAYGSKVFDYLGLNLLILHISNGGSLYSILSRRGHFCTRYDKSQLVETLGEIRNTRSRERPSVKYEDFSFDNIAEHFLKIIND